ncbi:MAG: DUF2505 domain-containing protein [Actinomycetales bacterium]|nr:DUF2505 domain-containing protein [Actinomycetales bacterium]
MKINKSYDYPADVQQVFDLVTSKEFREECCVYQDSPEYSVDVTDEDGTTVIRIERKERNDLPDFVKRLTGEYVKVIQVEKWAPDDGSGVRTAQIFVDIVGQPAQMKGTSTLSASNGSSVLAVNGDIKVAIPLIGRKIEPEIAKAISASLDKDVELGSTKL